MKRLLLLLSFFLLSLSYSFAGGFQINENGAKGMAMAGAFTGLANDPSAVYYNPGGLTQLTGTNFYGGVCLIKPGTTFRGPLPENTEWKLKDQLFTPYNLYIHHQISDDLHFGFGANNQYGLGTKWDENWVGSQLAVETEIRTFFFSGVIAYKISDQLSIGAGPVFAYGDVIISKQNSLGQFQGNAFLELSGDATAFGYAAGILYKPSEMFSFGLSYRSQVKFEFDGTAELTAPKVLLENGQIPYGPVSAPMTTPENITLGIAYFPTDNITVTGDFQYIGWDSYDKLAVTFNDFTDEYGDKIQSINPRNFENAWIARLGAEYKLSEDFALRGGLLYDSNPVKDEKLDPTLPDADRLGLNIGFGYQITNKMAVDVAYLYLRFEERKITDSHETYTKGFAPFNGVYNCNAHLLGINFTYSL